MSSHSPQSVAKCACPQFSSAQGCIERRYGENDLHEECECLCHREDDEYSLSASNTALQRIVSVANDIRISEKAALNLIRDLALNALADTDA